MWFSLLSVTTTQEETMHSDDQRRPARFTVRLDHKLRNIIETAAEASRCSLNAEICHRIERAFIEQRSDAAEEARA
jgi:predicted HicB family RNase H-like nuclease